MDAHQSTDQGDMGACSSCNKEDKNGGSEAFLQSDSSQGSKLEYQWEQDLLDDVIKCGRVDKIAIVGQDGALRAWAPPDFLPEKQGLEDILEAFKSNVEGLAERGLFLGAGTKASVPGKIFENKCIYGNDGQGGGISAFKSNTAVVVVVFSKDPTPANRLGLETADHLIDNDR